MEIYVVMESAVIKYEEFERPMGVFSSEAKAQEAVEIYTQESKDVGDNYDYYYIKRELDKIYRHIDID